MGASMPQQSANDLWADAAEQLSNDDKQHINFSRSDKLNILAELHADAERLRQRSINSRWKYTRKSGETVIIRDVFEKIVRWINTFKQIGDVAVQYDPVHAALPWAGIRFLLQIAISDFHRLALVVEGLARIAELICRHAVTEALYIQSASKAGGGLEKAVVKLYASILSHLSKARQYFEQGTAKRVIKSAVLDTQLDSGLEGIRTAEEEIDRWMALVNRDESVENHAELVRLLTSMDVPLRRMDDSLKNIHDDLQKWKRGEILKWLSPEPYKEHHKLAMQGILPRTGQWLLSNPVFKKWKDESASSILWLHGIQGSGKSKLVSIVIEDALKSFKAGDSPQPVFFYCSRNPAEPARSDPKAILASLARQLSSLEPGEPLFQPSIDLYRKEEAEGFASGQLQVDESCQLIMQLIELYPQATIIIDAIDECDLTTRLEFLQTLKHILLQSPSLVKVFLSSRDDQDLVLELSGYLSVEINSQRNSYDIAQFVKAEVTKLIQTKKLLRHSTAQTEMKKMIINKVIEGAAGMFRWASMQLQHLCSFKLDTDIRNSLGRLPPDLHTLYNEIYDALSATPGPSQAMVFKNVLHWLLCAQRKLHADEFLAVVSIDIRRENSTDPISKDLVLEICNNFVIFDSELETFRFHHLSVREFLETRPEFDRSATNGLIAEFCLWSMLSTGRELATEKLFLQLGLCAKPAPASAELLRAYADVYWAIHCKSAGRERESGTLRMLLQHILCNSEAASSLDLWSFRLQTHLKTDRYREIEGELRNAMTSAEMVSPPGLFVCCVFDFEEHIENILGGETPGAFYINSYGRSHLRVAAENGSCATLARLITKHWPNTKLPVEVATAAAGNSDNGKEVMALLLDRRGADVAITEEVVKAAAGNFGNGKEVMALLLDRQGADVTITEEVVKAAAGNSGNGKEVMALLLNQRRADVTITEEVVKAAAGNFGNGKEVMALLLDQRGADVTITEEVLQVAVGNYSNGKEVMALLLDRRGADVTITEEVVKAAAGNSSFNGKEMMALLLNQRGADVTITEDVVKAAAGNFIHGKEMMALLLDRRGADVMITEEVVKAAVGNSHNSKEVMALLLNQRGADVTITEEVVKAAAGNTGNGKEMMALLLDWRGADVMITEEVVKAAAGNYGNGKEVMALLLGRRGADVPITKKVLKVAAGNFLTGKEVMALLLDRRGADVTITEEVVRAAAGNSGNGKEVMALLLDQRGADITITEEVVKAAAGNHSNGREVMALLLDRRGADVAITKEVLKAAAGNLGNGKEVMALLLDQRGADVTITEEVVKAAAGNTSNGKEMMALLLDRRGADVAITEEVLKAAAGNFGNGKEVMALLLDQRGADITITEEVTKAAADNSSFNGREMMALLLDRRGADVIITEEVVRAAAGNSGNGKEVMALLLNQQGADITVTEEVVKAAAGNYGNGREVMALLLDRRGADVAITEEVLKAAAGNFGNGKEVMALLLDQRGADITITEEVTKAAADNSSFNGKEMMALLLDRRGSDVPVTEDIVVRIVERFD